MLEDNQKDGSISDAKMKDHLANERTYLSWIRTCVGLMAFGFVIERFSLFERQLSALVHKGTAANESSSNLGITVIALGTVICLFAFFKYKKNLTQIEKSEYHPSLLLNTLLTLAILSIGICIFIYMLMVEK